MNVNKYKHAYIHFYYKYFLRAYMASTVLFIGFRSEHKKMVLMHVVKNTRERSARAAGKGAMGVGALRGDI